MNQRSTIVLVAMFLANFDDELISPLAASSVLRFVWLHIIGSGTWITYGPMMTTGNSCSTDFILNLENTSLVNRYTCFKGRDTNCRIAFCAG